MYQVTVRARMKWQECSPSGLTSKGWQRRTALWHTVPVLFWTLSGPYRQRAAPLLRLALTVGLPQARPCQTVGCERSKSGPALP